MSNAALERADACARAASAAGSRPGCPRGPRSSRWTRTARSKFGTIDRCTSGRRTSRISSSVSLVRLGARRTRARPSRSRACRPAAAGRRSRRARRCRGSSSTKPTSSQAVLGVRVELALDAGGPSAPAPTISVAPRAHHVREHPRAHARRAARARARARGRGTSAPRAASRSKTSKPFFEALADHEQRERAGEQRVEEVGDLVEAARARSPASGARRAGRRRRSPSHVSVIAGTSSDQQPVRGDDRRRPDLLGQQVRAGQRDQDRDEVAPNSRPGRGRARSRPADARAQAQRAAGRPAAQAGAAPRCRRSRPSAQDASRSRGITRSCMWA